MGIFTSNTLSSVSGVDYTELPALEGYDATTGCAMAMLEVQQNDMALFNATIMEDFKEVAAVNEGYEVLNESASDVLNKIKEIFKKLLQKIKGIFKAFLAKLMGTFGTNAGMYQKYSKQISSYNNWKDFKVKDFRAIKGGGDGISKIDTIGEWKNSDKVDYSKFIVTASSNIQDIIDAAKSAVKSAPKYGEVKNSLYGIDITKKADEFADSDDIRIAIMKERLCDELSSNVDGDLKNMTEEFMDAVFEEKETKDEWTAADILRGCVGSVLEKNAGGKFKESVQKGNDKLSSAISKIINELDKLSVKINTAAGKSNLAKDGEELGKFTTTISGYKSTNSKHKVNNISGIEKSEGEEITVQKNDTFFSTCIANLQKIATQEQQVITSFTAARLTATKFLIQQARKVWSSAAAYSSREHKNEGYEFYTAVGESAAYDFTSYMEAIGE